MRNPDYAGSNYDSDRDVADIAKILRKTIKASYPGIKARVAIKRYSGGCSLGVTIVAANFQVLTDSFVDARKAGNWDYSGRSCYTPAAIEIKDELAALARSYTYREVDTMTDYFNVSCYTDADFDRNKILTAEAEGRVSLVAKPKRAQSRAARKPAARKPAEIAARPAHWDNMTAGKKAAWTKAFRTGQVAIHRCERRS